MEKIDTNFTFDDAKWSQVDGEQKETTSADLTWKWYNWIQDSAIFTASLGMQLVL